MSIERRGLTRAQNSGSPPTFTAGRSRRASMRGWRVPAPVLSVFAVRSSSRISCNDAHGLRIASRSSAAQRGDQRLSAENELSRACPRGGMDDEDSNRSAGASAFASGFSLGGRQFVAQRTDRSTSASFSRSPSNIRSSSARLASLAFINGPQRARDDDRQFARSPVSPSIHSSSPSGLTRSLAAAAAANRSDSGSSASGSPKSEATLTVDDARPADPVRPRAPVQLGKSADGPSVVVRPIVESTEATPLLAQLSGESTGRKRWTDTLRQRWHGKAFSWRAARDAPRRVGAVLPSVFLGTLLNILDGSSYGVRPTETVPRRASLGGGLSRLSHQALLFPAAPIFASSSVLGLSMFFVTTIVSWSETGAR